jgi:hypothetical protein
MKEMFDAAKNVDELVLDRAGIFSRLGTMGVKSIAQRRHEGHQPRGERLSPQKLRLPVGMPESKY